MRPSVTVRNAVVAAAALALAGIPGLANAATTWSVAHPPYTAIDNVPYVPLNAITAISATNVWTVGQDSGTPQSTTGTAASGRERVALRPVRRVRGRLRAHRS